MVLLLNKQTNKKWLDNKDYYATVINQFIEKYIQTKKGN